MEETNKTFELHLNEYIIKGIITSLNDEEIDTIENLGSKEYSEAVFKVMVSSEPLVDLELFNISTTKIYIVGYKGREGQLGYLKNMQFIPDDEENHFVNVISTNILSVLMLNGNSGHFTSK
ncbi:hypothetical protein SAMN05421786_103237 [Chryseobacterium ureilyticum]|uniref:Uncharacterized protein n=1 Tax=Chryseobacterium ureilyticum TaxID=373668 RepID=A0A1N7N5N7_9FLAO|nr:MULTISPECIES: hypothetical protein [Chryseobacterium]MDR6921223.1 hypothetical protein [Chryseobacterium sp. 2987]SIS93664.1 hypothetical protein SAMN05421786_103237 [Chryseobacterium ureilyticum]